MAGSREASLSRRDGNYVAQISARIKGLSVRCAGDTHSVTPERRLSGSQGSVRRLKAIGRIPARKGIISSSIDKGRDFDMPFCEEGHAISA
jgi:hypothetical protein